MTRGRFAKPRLGARHRSRDDQPDRCGGRGVGPGRGGFQADKVIRDMLDTKEPPPFRGGIRCSHWPSAINRRFLYCATSRSRSTPARRSASSAPRAAANRLSPASFRASMTQTPDTSPSMASISATTHRGGYVARSVSRCRIRCCSAELSAATSRSVVPTRRKATLFAA